MYGPRLELGRSDMTLLEDGAALLQSCVERRKLSGECVCVDVAPDGCAITTKPEFE